MTTETVTVTEGHPVLLSVKDLSVRFLSGDGVVAAVNDVSFDLAAGELLALVGESGCGKSVLATALLGLLPGNAEVRGEARLGDLELLSATERVLVREVRGRWLGWVPQSPASHLTPVRTVRAQLAEALRAVGRPRAHADEVAARVGLPATVLGAYPHELSGGQAQRAGNAIALAGDPRVLLADEPTTGLDRSLIDRVVGELRALADDGRAVLLVTHDLDTASRVADRIAVMYAGRLVETAPAATLMASPRHPYTIGLLNALPSHGFAPVPGLPPELTALPIGCAFAPRCPFAGEDCTVRPQLRIVGDGSVACHRDEVVRRHDADR